MAMPTGTRSSISTNSTMKPMIATASELMGVSLDRLDLIGAGDAFGMEDEAIGAHRDEKYGRDVADPRHGEERPRGQTEIQGQHVVGAGADDLVEQRPGMYRHDEQKHQRGEHVDRALQLRADIGPQEIDRDVGAAIAGRADAPEDQDAEQQTAEIVGVGDRRIEEIA